MDTLFSHATIVTMDDRLNLYTDAFLGVTDGKISHLGINPPEEKPEKIIDATGMVLMPGLINCHTHNPMSYLRGYAEDLNLHDWLTQKIFPTEKKLNARIVKASTLLSIAEALRFGTTSFSDMYRYTDAVAEAVAESGIKANLAQHTEYFGLEEDYDPKNDPLYAEGERLHHKWHGYDNGRIRVNTCIHAEYTSKYPLWDAIAEYAINENLPVHVHLSETKQEHEDCIERTGLTPAQVLDCHHVFDRGGLAAHCVWLDEKIDMPLLAKRHVSAVHCPSSNMKLASGAANVMGMVKAGMNVCLGTDSVASNNKLDLFEEMRAAAMMAKLRTLDPTALPVEAVLMMATVCGARAQGREKECGQIAIGYDADLILLDFNQPHLIPCHNVLSHLVFSASGSDVVLTMVRGKILYCAGKFPTIDLSAVLQELHDYAIPTIFSDQKETPTA